MPDYARACRPPDYAPNYAIMPSIMARALPRTGRTVAEAAEHSLPVSLFIRCKGRTVAVTEPAWRAGSPVVLMYPPCCA